jgi:glycogen debranching enzyme
MPESPRRKGRRHHRKDRIPSTSPHHPSQTAHEQYGQRQATQARHERRQRVLTQGRSAMVSSVADAVVVKNENVFFLTAPNGSVPGAEEHGFGLYYHDCRFLNGYELKLAGMAPVVLASTAHAGYMAVFELTNPDLQADHGRVIPKEEIGIHWERLLDDQRLMLNDVLTFRNFGRAPCAFPVTLTFQADFEDIFAVREVSHEPYGTLHKPAWQDGALTFLYHGADRLQRALTIAFAPPPQATGDTTAHFRVRLSPGESQALAISLGMTEVPEGTTVHPNTHPVPHLQHIIHRIQGASEQWVNQHTDIRSDSLLLNSILSRSLCDLCTLRARQEGLEYFAAGVPWFVTLFGRDTILTALQTLAYQPQIAEQTLRILAHYQGQKVDDWRDEQPGKILHELRVGEWARIGAIPHTPFYGTIDATPLFLILLGRHAAWTGKLDLFHELRDAVERALQWIAQYGDLNGDGYIEDQSTSTHGLVNQGWKDSGDAIVRADGSLATPPIALVEVQGYVFWAKRTIADLYERIGDAAQAQRLRSEADALRGQFNRDFWDADLGTYILALEAHHRPVAVVSSNPGHALWAGIADADKARQTAERLMADDMFTGWGIRTLSTRERRYNPIGYHLGTVWPHDNAIIAAGLRRYGCDAAALRIMAGVVEAAMHFRHYRLPEVFAGFPRQAFQVPVHYPVACHPQAWAAGAIPYLVTTCLGLEPDAFAQGLRIVRPILPTFVDRLEIRGLRVGAGMADLQFQRTPDGVRAQVLRTAGALEAQIET